MKIANIDFTGIAILGGAALVAFLAYKAYKSTQSALSAAGDLAHDAGRALANGANTVSNAVSHPLQTLGFNTSNPNPISDDMSGDDFRVRMWLINKNTASATSLAEWAAEQPGTRTDSGMDMSAF